MRWQLLPCDDAAAAQLAAAAHLHPLVARLLVQRGISTPEAAAAFLAPALAQLHSPYLMTGMREAITRLEAAIARREKILIYGDYDVDGTTAVVILKTAIELCGGAADFHVPHRIREGYGMRDEVIERAAADGIRLIISVDTGIRAFVAADTARRLGTTFRWRRISTRGILSSSRPAAARSPTWAAWSWTRRTPRMPWNFAPRCPANSVRSKKLSGCSRASRP